MTASDSLDTGSLLIILGIVKSMAGDDLNHSEGRFHTYLGEGIAISSKKHMSLWKEMDSIIEPNAFHYNYHH